ncbi:hypothetical protein ScPMuIL_014247 [Solemya velum]
MEINILPPLPLSASYEGTFAYYTIRDRLPAILSKIADTVFRKKNETGEEGREDLKSIVGRISKLRNELQTDKPLIQIEDTRSDTDVWNQELHRREIRAEAPPSWFKSPWLYVECYMYRRVEEAVKMSKILTTMDVFEELKQSSFLDSQAATINLMMFLLETVKKLQKDASHQDLYKLFQCFVQVSLWGNKCDLSISGGSDNAQTSPLIEQLHLLEDNIIIDDIAQVWQCLQDAKSKSGQPGRVDIVLDNAGFECITDLCLAEFLLSANIASSIHFHLKAMPWFVSDLTQSDWDWTIQKLCSSNNLAMSKFGSKWKQLVKNGSWVLHADDFWTMPFSYSEMSHFAPELYKQLGTSSIVFLKGDLNYRKLVGDLNWDTTTPFEVSLQGFHPAPLCSLRTLKADVVVGLKPGRAKEIATKEKDWMVTGNWAVISFCSKVC